jgi:tetratricopeptide (TPR) repeat protein
MRIGLSLLLWASAFGAATSATAQTPAPGPTPGASQAQPAPSVRRDARGIKGISPFREALKKGDNAFIARDFDAAIIAYREAITNEPENALGHYRLGEAQLQKADLGEAEASFAAGLRFVGADAPLKAKLQFGLADVHERQKSYDAALGNWTDYQTLTAEQQESEGFPATAIERKRALEVWKKLSADAAEVKARIEKRLQSADESMRKSSK